MLNWSNTHGKQIFIVQVDEDTLANVVVVEQTPKLYFSGRTDILANVVVVEQTP